MQFRALVVDPFGAARINAVQAIRTLGAFHDVASSPSILSAREFCLNKDQVDLVFLSYRLDGEQCKSLIHEIKNRFVKRGCAVISVMRGFEASDLSMATALAQGTDGILCEPFSVDNVNHAVEVAAKMKLSGGKERAKAGLSLVLTSIVEHVQLDADGDIVINDNDRIWMELIDICKNIKGLAGLAGASYDEIINELFRNIANRSEEMKNTVSRRLQDRFQLAAKARDYIYKRLLTVE